MARMLKAPTPLPAVLPPGPMVEQEKAFYIVLIDHYSDCHDMYDLVCGGKGSPQDKRQRLAILALREARLCGAVRRFYHVPTDVKLADALTKSGLFTLFMEWLTTGE